MILLVSDCVWLITITTTHLLSLQSGLSSHVWSFLTTQIAILPYLFIANQDSTRIVGLSFTVVGSHFATLELHLVFSAKLRIWQDSACKMEPRSVTIITDWASQQPTHTAINLPYSFNVVQCPHPNCSPHQEGMCGVPPLSIVFFSEVSHVVLYIYHLALSWILSEVENLPSSNL